jgi:hypothetical protein
VQFKTKELAHCSVAMLGLRHWLLLHTNTASCALTLPASRWATAASTQALPQQAQRRLITSQDASAAAAEQPLSPQLISSLQV